MSVLGNPLLITPEGYQISRSVRLRSSAGGFFNRTPASVGNLSTWTWSAWVKRGTLSSGYQTLFMGGNTADNNTLAICFTPSDVFQIQGYSTAYFVSNQLFRDPSAWYHIVVAFDSTQATQANRIKVYVNGVQITASTNALPLNGTWNLNNNLTQTIGYQSAVWGFAYFDGYMTEMNFVNAQQLTASSFGETNPVTGVWQPKKYTGTYGTNGFYLNFSDNSAATAAAIGKDWSGNGNNWTPNNISVTAGATYDSMLDVPTLWADGGNGRGNYCVLNPLWKETNTTIQDGNLTVICPVSGTGQARGSIGVTSGKWYWEFTCQSGNNNDVAGIVRDGASLSGLLGSDSNGWAYYGFDGKKINNGVQTVYGAAYTSGDIIGVAFDADAGSLTFYKNNVSQGAAFTGLTSGPYYPAHGDASGSLATQAAYNFGQRPFAYTPPTGFKALNTQNLPDATIKKGNAYFDVALQTGNTTGRTVSGLGFQPDLVWVKNRAGSANRRWGLIDSVRGVNKTLSSSLTDAEVTSQSDLLTAFNSDGFTIGADAGLYGWNGYAESYVHFTWKESASAGFDIVTYTGTGSSSTVVSHSLGVKPSMIITKIRSSGSVGWATTHKSLGTNMSDNYIYLNTTAAAATSAGVWGAEPTSTTFGSSVNIHSSTVGATVVAYLFAEVAGFSKFGSYTGNGSADGPFVYCGFRPRFVMIKRSDGAEQWMVYDSARDTYNVETQYLTPNSSAAEAALASSIDFVSNGFKVRYNSSPLNLSSGTYIYACFAENPFKTSLAR